MSPVFTVLAASVTTFAATNLDDFFLLTVFFARRVATRRIVAGQYLGFAAIVLVSLAGVWAAGAAAHQGWIRLLGIFPLAIGSQPHWERAEQRLKAKLGDAGWNNMRQAVSRMTEAAIQA